MIDLISPDELPLRLAGLIREERLSQNLTQAQLADQANVSLSVLKKFESSGKISLESFAKLAFVLGFTDSMISALKPQGESYQSLDDVISEAGKPKRKRAYNPRKKKS